MSKILAIAMLFSVFAVCNVPQTAAQMTAFTYQGSLKDGASPANGNYDFEFALFDSLSGGNQAGATLPKNGVAVANGIFSVKLDFGMAFPGANRFLEIRVKFAGQPTLTPLTPRQAINSSPYAVTSGDATSPNIARLTVLNTAMTAAAVPVVNSGFITSANVTGGGAGYATPPTVTVNDATGSGAVLTANLSGGSVTSITVQNPGGGYSANATLTLTAPPSNANQTFVTPNFFTNTNNTFAGSGAGLTNVNAAQLGSLPPSRFVQSDANGNVGIGASPAAGSRLTVNGQIEMTTGGLKFPDATTQTTAGLSTVATSAPLTGSGTAASPLGVTSPLAIRDQDNPAFQPFKAAANTQSAILVTVPTGKRLVIESVYGSLRQTGNNQAISISLSATGVSSFYEIAPNFARNDSTDTISFFTQPVKLYLAPGEQLQVFFPNNATFRSIVVSGYFVNLPGPPVAQPRQ
jgi:hypothetical protein